MTHSLTNRLPLLALLRNANGIDTPVKNSLCCAAAGINKAFRATAGELIPHIKLREAEHLNAPLNAKNRPPAQLVVGYKSTPLSSQLIQFHVAQLGCSNASSLRIHCKYSCATHSIYNLFSRKQLSKDNALLKCPPNFQERLNHFWQWQFDRIYPSQCEQLLFNSSQNLGFECLITVLHLLKISEEQAANCSCSYGNTTYQFHSHLISSPTGLSGIPSLFISNKQCSEYGRKTSNRLHPCRSSLRSSECVEHYKQSPTQRANSKKDPYNHNCVNAHLGRYLKSFQKIWPLASIQTSRLPKPMPHVHGEQT